MSKSPDAFRTISEVADWLDRPAHVLRFWESKFTQVRPIKRAGGRRYFRPQDMLLLGGIKKLLHDDGLTIKGVQKILREQGIEHVSALSQPLDEDAESGALVPSPEKVAALKVQTEPQEPDTATLLHFPNTGEAEEELTEARYEEAAEELAPIADPVPEEEVGAPEGPIADFTEDAPVVEESTEPAPSFFSMFEEESAEEAPVAPVEDAPAETAEEQALDPIEEPEATAVPAIVDVPVEAESQAGAGILTRLMTAKSKGLGAEPAQIQELRTQISALTAKLAQN